VIDRRERSIGPRHRPAALPQRVERLRCRDLVNQMKPDEDLRRTCRERADFMKVPDLLQDVLPMGESQS
jgi:hypothetical protein